MRETRILEFKETITNGASGRTEPGQGRSCEGRR